MPTPMISTQDAVSFSVPDKQYTVDAHGLVEVDDAHIPFALQHGFRKANAEEAALVVTAAAELTPAVVASMNRAQLVTFLEARGVEDIPDRTGALRQHVMDIADHEADIAAGAVKKEPVQEEPQPAPPLRGSRNRVSPPEGDSGAGGETPPAA